MSNRPSMPAEMSREVLIESGHRCAVCGTPCPLERAHIIPWHRSREHKTEDLICLCANCHQRADLEKWGEKTLREYKRRPWVIRQYENTDRRPEPTARLELTIELDIQDLSEKNQRWLQYAIAAFLEIPPNDIRIVSFERGSVKVTIELAVQSAERLLISYERNEPELAKYLDPLVLLDLRRKAAGREEISTPFQAGGGLTDEHAGVYVERKADHEVLAQLRAMDYVLLVESRQQGKTSLINHLMSHPSLGDLAIVYLDVTTPDRSTEATWYQTLCSRILDQLRFPISRRQWPSVPENSVGWRDFLSEVAVLATNAHRRMVIALDEIGATTFPGATAFFGVLRDVHSSRQAEAELGQLTFLLAGAFHPRDLIRDQRISPFNVAHRVRLADLSLAQVSELVSKGGWSHEQAAALANRIHYWTDGQPYLTQLLCSYLGPDAAPTDVSAGVERLYREDDNHLPPLFNRLHADKDLENYVQRIGGGERIKFVPRLNRRQSKLELLGIIKADDEGYCRIRNRIYEQALQIQTEPAQPREPHSVSDDYLYDVFISYSHHDKEWVNDRLLPWLEAAGLRVCIDFRDFKPGLPILVNIENAVDRSRKTLIVLTPEWVDSQWTTFESLLIQTDDPAGRKARMIPLRLKPCELPKRIAMLTYVDFTQPSEVEVQLERLEAAIHA